MPRLIDADILRSAKFHALPYTHIHALGAEPYSYELGWNDALDAVADSAPTVDAVEVVRCKDCKFMEIESSGKYWVARCSIKNQILNPSGFCESGERRE